MADFFGIKRNKELKEITADSIGALSSDNGAVKTANINDGAVTGQKIADNTITMVNLSNNVKYTKTYWRSTPSELLAAWNRGIVYPDSGSMYFRISPRITSSADALPVGYRCRIVAYLQTELRWSGFSASSIEIISSGEGKIYYATDGVISIPKGRYIDIEKGGGTIWILSGNYADHMISYGTAAPSGGNDGDVYIQYS